MNYTLDIVIIVSCNCARNYRPSFLGRELIPYTLPSMSSVIYEVFLYIFCFCAGNHFKI